MLLALERVVVVVWFMHVTSYLYSHRETMVVIAWVRFYGNCYLMRRWMLLLTDRKRQCGDQPRHRWPISSGMSESEMRLYAHEMGGLIECFHLLQLDWAWLPVTIAIDETKVSCGQCVCLCSLGAIKRHARLSLPCWWLWGEQSIRLRCVQHPNRISTLTWFLSNEQRLLWLIKTYFHVSYMPGNEMKLI